MNRHSSTIFHIFSTLFSPRVCSYAIVLLTSLFCYQQSWGANYDVLNTGDVGADTLRGSLALISADGDTLIFGNSDNFPGTINLLSDLAPVTFDFGFVNLDGGTIVISRNDPGSSQLFDFSGSIEISGFDDSFEMQAFADDQTAAIVAENLLISGGLGSRITVGTASGMTLGVGADLLVIDGDLSSDIQVNTQTGDAFGLYSNTNMLIDGVINGQIRVQSDIGFAHALFAEGDLVVTQGITGNINTSTEISDSHVLWSEAGSIVIENGISGTLSATTSGIYASGIDAIGDISITGGISGAITTNAGVDGSFGIFADLGDVMISGGISGDISSTAGGHTAIGIYAPDGAINGGDLSRPLYISGNVKAEADGLAVGIAAADGMNLDISGVVSGIDNSGSGQGYAIRSGYEDGVGNWLENGAVDSVVIRSGAILVGKVDLSGGDDSFTLVGSGIRIDESVSGGSGYDSLNLTGDGYAIIDFPVINFERLTKSGTGTWSLMENLDMGASGVTFINSGVLAVNSILTSPSVLVARDGTLAGNGTINGNVVNSGKISPGNSVGTLYINGNYTHQPGSVYLAELHSSGGDRIIVSGTSDLNGGVIRPVLRRSLFRDNQSLTVLSSQGGITGSLAGGALQGTEILSTSISQSPTEINLTVHRKSYGDFGTNSNQQSLGRALDSIVPYASGAGDFIESFLVSLDFDYSAAEISQVLGGLDPQIYTGFVSTTHLVAQQFQNSMRTRSRGVHDLKAFSLDTFSPAEGSSITSAHGLVAPDEENGNNWQIWGHIYGGMSDKELDSHYYGYQMSTSSIVMGADRRFSTDLRLGSAISGGSSSFDFTNGDSGEQTSFQAGIYGDSVLGNFENDFSLSFGWHEGEAEREINLPMLNYLITPEADTTSILLHLGTHYRLTTDNIGFGPMAAIDLASIEMDDISENSGSFLDLHISDTSKTYLSSTLGLRFSSLFRVKDFTVIPHLELSWLHQFMDDDISMTAAFREYSQTPFGVKGNGGPTDSLSIQAGVRTEISNSFHAYLDFVSQVAPDYYDLYGSLGVEYRF